MKLLDTSAWVEYFKGSEKGVVVKQILEVSEVYVSALTLAEISRWVYENGGDVLFAIENIKKNAVVLPLEDSILVESGIQYVNLRKIKKKISMIDVIIYVTSAVHGLVLVPGDSDFKGLMGVELI